MSCRIKMIANSRDSALHAFLRRILIAPRKVTDGTLDW
jgi:hypothetical protein